MRVQGLVNIPGTTFHLVSRCSPLQHRDPFVQSRWPGQRAAACTSPFKLLQAPEECPWALEFDQIDKFNAYRHILAQTACSLIAMGSLCSFMLYRT